MAPKILAHPPPLLIGPRPQILAVARVHQPQHASGLENMTGSARDLLNLLWGWLRHNFLAAKVSFWGRGHKIPNLAPNHLKLNQLLNCLKGKTTKGTI